MSFTVLRAGKPPYHYCNPPPPRMEGTIIRCNECRRRYTARRERGELIWVRRILPWPRYADYEKVW